MSTLSCVNPLLNVFTQRRVRFIVSALTLIMVSTIAVAQAKTLVVTRVADTHDQIMGGVIARVAFAKIGIELKFIDLPADRAMETSASGKVDAELQRIYGFADQRPTLLRVPTPYTYMDVVVFGAKPNFKIDGWNSLKAFTVSMVRGHLFAEIGLQGHKQLLLVSTTNNQFKALQAGRTELAVSTWYDGMYAAHELGLELFPLEPRLERTPLYFYLHKKNAHLVETIDAVFREMKISGELEQVRADYIKRTILNHPRGKNLTPLSNE
ncbi:MAG: transporter substrate-binding domain-containing protein [Methylococcales bacterium]|nr:transporter substrate-binding domain-containing protein [Methylococcales bacterium]